MEPYIINFLIFFLGLFLGHRLNLGRELRKEFNDAAIPIRKWILDEIKNPSPYFKSPTDIELDTFVHYLPWWKRGGFNKAYARQKDEREKATARDSIGGVFYNDNKHIIKALHECFSFTNRR